MFKILDDFTILLTRGDVANIILLPVLEDGSPYKFISGDILSLKIMEKKMCDKIVLEKTVSINKEQTECVFNLTKEDTTFGEIINRPVEYWYEIELNPDTEPQTLVGYDENGPKIFILYPEGA